MWKELGDVVMTSMISHFMVLAPFNTPIRLSGETQTIQLEKQEGVDMQTAHVVFKADVSARNAAELNGSILMPFRIPVKVFRKSAPPMPSKHGGQPTTNGATPKSMVWRKTDATDKTVTTVALPSAP